MNFEGAFYNTDEFELLKKRLGKGTFGTVFVVKNKKDGHEYAAKIININEGFNGYQQMLLLRESLTLNNLNHPAIIKFIGLNFQSFTNIDQFQPTIITEYMPNGSLKDNLRKERDNIAEFDWNPTKKYIILLGITNAMSYLHKNGIIHRDLKPENILNDSNYYPRICDFGLARCLPDSISKSRQKSMTGQIGTPLYMAPELLRDDRHYGKAVDVYAFGILAYEIVTGEEPFSELGKMNPYAFSDEVKAGKRPKINQGQMSKKMEILLKKCWDGNPGNRPSFDEIYNDLSKDFSYSNESIDEDEVKLYIDILEEANSNQNNLIDKNLSNVKSEEIVEKNYKKKVILNFFAVLTFSLLIVAFLFQVGCIQKRTNNNEYKMQIDELRETNKKLLINQKKFDELKKQNDLLMKNNNAKQDIIDIKQANINDKQKKIDELVSQNNAKQNIINNKQADINDKQKKIDELVSQNNVKQDIIDNKQADINDKQKKIDELVSQNNAKQNIIDNKQADINDKQKKIDELVIQNNNKQSEINNLNSKIDEVEKNYRELVEEVEFEKTIKERAKKCLLSPNLISRCNCDPKKSCYDIRICIFKCPFKKST